MYFRNALKSKQSLIATGVDYEQDTEHTQMELLYISFMEPSAERLSYEWNISIIKVEEILEGMPTHEHEEFAFLGTLYDRNMIDDLAPYKSLQVSGSVREESTIEVNHLTP